MGNFIGRVKNFLSAWKQCLVLACVLTLVFAGKALAGTEGAEFQNIYTLIQGWTTGYLGKTIAVGMFLTGIGMGIARQSIISIVTGIASGMAVAYTPDIVDSIVTAMIA